MTPEWRRNWLMAALVLVFGGGAAYGLLVGKPGPEPQAPPEIAPPRVDVVAVQPEERALTVQTQGTVQPLREINLVSQVAGRVVSTANSFAAGGFFAADEPLLQVEQADYEFAIARAESQVAAAQQRLAEEQAAEVHGNRDAQQAARPFTKPGDARLGGIELFAGYQATLEGELKEWVTVAVRVVALAVDLAVPLVGLTRVVEPVRGFEVDLDGDRGCHSIPFMGSK